MLYNAVMRVYCKTPLTLEMWYITAPVKMTDCETHHFHNFLDTSTLVTKKLYRLHMISHGMHGSDIYLHSGKKLSFSTCMTCVYTRLGPKCPTFDTFSDNYPYTYIYIYILLYYLVIIILYIYIFVYIILFYTVITRQHCKTVIFLYVLPCIYFNK